MRHGCTVKSLSALRRVGAVDVLKIILTHSVGPLFLLVTRYKVLINCPF